MKSKIAMMALGVGLAGMTQMASAQTACIFDLAGTQGDTYTMMKDYVLAAKGWGVNLTLKPYTDERVAAEDFKAGKCDLVAISGMRGRQFNSFTGSLDAVGAVTSNASARSIMGLLANPKLAPDMVNGPYEIAGVIPLGSAYLLVNDRQLNTLAKAAGKRVGVLDFDKAQAKLVQKIGAQPVSSDIATYGSKFNNGQVDVIGAPALAIKPLELMRGLGTKGAIVRFPIAQVTGNVIINRSKFPADYGQKSRSWIGSQLPRAFDLIAKTEAAIPAKYWMDIPANDKVGYVKLMRESRIDLTREGLYNKKMMSLLKRVRCQSEPSSFECALKDE